MPTFSARIGASNDNAYRWPGNFPHWYTGGIEIGRPNDTADPHENAYLRWTNVTVPRGATITSAYITLARWYNSTLNLQMTIKGIAEDNTADFASDATGRTQTSAGVDWNNSSWTANVDVQSPDIKTIIQEIVNRAGWSSGNALGLRVNDRASALYSYGAFCYYPTYPLYTPLLTINYASPTILITKSSEYRVNAPHSITKQMAYGVDPEATPISFKGIKISKPGHNVLNTANPNSLIFSSDYNTLKYFSNGHVTKNVSHIANYLYTDTAYIEHNLGYYPFVIVYAKDDLMANYQPLGRFQAGSGAYRSFYYYMTTTRLYLVASGWTGAAPCNYNVDFYYKIFKNNLNL